MSQSTQTAPDETSASDAPSPKRRQRRWWLIPLTPLIIVGSLVLALAWMIATPSGAKVTLTTVADLLPMIEIGGVEGRLIDQLWLKQVRVYLDDLALGCEQIELHWHPQQLLEGEPLRIEQLVLHDLEVTLLPTTAPAQAPEPLDLSTITLPVAIQLDAATVNGLTVRPGEDPALHLQQLTMTGAIATSGVLHLNAEWQALTWPQDGSSPALTSPQGSVQLQGTLAELDYALASALTSPELPTVETLTLRGQVIDFAATQLEQFDIATLGGTIQGHGELVWSPLLRGAVEVQWTALDPGHYDADWPGQLDGHLKAHGYYSDDDWGAELDLVNLSGQLRDYPLSGHGQVQLDNAQLAIKQLILTSGASRLAVSGQLGETQTLVFALDAQNLDELLPGAQGRVQVSGRASGDLTQPAVNLTINADNVALDEQRLGQLSGTVAIDLSDTDAADLQLELDGQALSVGDLNFDRVQLIVDGQPQTHRLELHLDGEPLRLSVISRGSLTSHDPLLYQGTLGNLALQHPEFGEWQLTEPMPFTLDGLHLTTEPFCVRHADMDAGGCAEVDYRAEDDWQASLTTDALPLALLDAVLPAEHRLRGAVTAQATVRNQANQLTADAQLAIGEGRYSLLTDPALEIIDFSNTNVSLALDAAGLRAQWALPLAPFGQMSGTLSLPNWQPDDPLALTQPLNGELTARLQDQGQIAEWFPDLMLRGVLLASALQFGGTLEQPELSGQLELSDAALQLPALQLSLTDIAFKAEAQNLNTIVLSGGVGIGRERLAFSGEGQVRSLEDWSVFIRTRHDALNLALANGGIELLLVPDVRFTASSAEGLALTGQLAVPRGRITPQAMIAGEVSASPDIRLVTEADDPPPEAIPLELNLRLIIGQIELDAFGLEGNIGGNLRLLMPLGRPLVGEGQLAIREATYRFPTMERFPGRTSLVIGPPLQVTEGYLVFAQTPLTDPGLLLTAQRQGGDMTAGVRVIGTARDPRLSFFSDSDPGMTQAEASQFLLTGIPPRRRGEEQTAPELSIGTFVAPNLFVEYESRLGEQADRVRLRYKLSERIEVQTETGATQGADIFFKFER